MNRTNRAVFLDRDGVLIEDIGLLTEPSAIQIMPGAPEAMKLLASAGFRLIVVTNQPVISRGLITESGMANLNAEIERQLVARGAPPLDRFYVCPHHPRSQIKAYRVDCQCRKPRPGMLLQAASDFGLDMARCFIVGDRITDVLAGIAAGCCTVQIQTGRHNDPPIQTAEPVDLNVKPDWVCAHLPEAVEWILKQQ